jgi:hypothetical protein
MALKFGVATRNAELDAIETYIGTSATLKIFTGSAPANCAAADTGDELVEITLPSDWMAAAAAGVKDKTNTWEGTAADAGDAGYFRIYKSTTCEIQGTAGESGDSPDLVLDEKTIAVDDIVRVTKFELTAGNA